MKKNCFLILLFCIFTTVPVFAQSLSISGTVISAEDNLPMPGVSVAVKGATTGTITDVDGNYFLSVTQNAVLRFSMMGMITQEIAVNGKQVVNITLQPDNQLLDEIVVTGYTSEKKADITGSVSVVKLKDIASIPSGNVMTSLQGRVPGVNISADGQPGGTTTGTLIRGITTINNPSPLYIIDGVPTRDNVATLLNSNDVESIQVLKDAASASIYGIQAANGVIIITTKNAKKGKTTVNFDMQLTSQFYHNNIKMLNAQQWGDAYWQAYQNNGLTPAHDQYGNGETPVIPEFIDTELTMRAGNTDWAKEVYQTAVLQNYNLSVTNATDKSSTLFSFNYFDQDGLIKNTNFQRFNLRLNSTYKLWEDRIRVGENVNISKWKEVLKPDGIEELVIAQHPLIPVYDINGGYAGPTSGLGDKPNPVRLLNQVKDNYLNQWRIFGNLFVEIEPVKNLIFKSNFGLNNRSEFSSAFEPKWQEGTNRIVDKNSLYVKAVADNEWVWTNTLNYSFSRNKHAVNLLAGMEQKESSGRWMDGKREDYIIEDESYRYLNNGDGKQLNNGSGHLVRMRSYFGKINYAYDDRYLFSATVRNDATSRFGGKAATFPALTAGWRISNEKFMENVLIFDDLKLRASWGKNGNDLLDDYVLYSRYFTDFVSGGYDIGGINQGNVPAGILKEYTGNPDIQWEITTQTNAGIDLAMLKNRLVFTMDAFIKKTTGMLINKPYIATKGEGAYMAYNGADLEAKGIEGAITWRDKIGRDFGYEITFTGTVNRTIVTDLPDEIYYTWGGGNGKDKTIVGQPLGAWMGYKTNGLYRTEDDLNDGISQAGKGLGRIRYVNVDDSDNTINDNDRTWLGSDQLKFIGGLNLAFTYKNFDCAFYFNGLVRDAWNNSKYYTDFFQLWTGNHSTRLLDAWSIDNAKSNIPALTATNENDEGRGSEYFIEDGSYIKLKNFQLGYTLPKSWLHKVKIENVRVYVQAQDLFTITRYTGPDPEALGYPYPIPRTFTLGLNISL
ncbi:MAG: TonB-dependent receptor [Candidatus Symbiothrix sp.]|nr:TonB-dependent receptor [Candidatus Symbiothrix sp.]